MSNVVRLLVVAALRHYRDPLSWAGIIAAVGAATHSTMAPEYAASIETILGSVVGILLLMADGRSNPNTTVAGQISERPVVPSGMSPVVTPTRLNGAGAVVLPPETLPDGSKLVSTKPIPPEKTA